MNQNYYTSYVRHCLRFYFLYPVPPHNMDCVSKANREACDVALSQTELTPDFPFEYYERIYTSPGWFKNNVRELADEMLNGDIEYVWHKIRTLERKVAIIRGLYDPS